MHSTSEMQPFSAEGVPLDNHGTCQRTRNIQIQLATSLHALALGHCTQLNAHLHAALQNACSHGRMMSWRRNAGSSRRSRASCLWQEWGPICIASCSRLCKAD